MSTQPQHAASQSQPSHSAGIADAVVIKDADLFLVSRPDGSVPAGGGHGYGLYFHDCRYLSKYELRISGAFAEPLAHDSSDGFRSRFELTNPQIGPAGKGLGRQRVGLSWRHVIDAGARALRDEIVIENYDMEDHDLSLELTVDADFRDMFVIRGIIDKRPGTPQPATWQGEELVFSYKGGDRRTRELRIRVSDAPSWKQDGQLRYDWHLRSHETKRLIVAMAVIETEASPMQVKVSAKHDDLHGAEASFQRSVDDWMEGFPEVTSDSVWLESTMERSLRDLRALRMELHGLHFIAGGIPWFATLFGRDSVICAMEMLAYRPQIAAETLQLLASLQGTRQDPARDEEPGKIMHELRVGELAQMGEIPYTPYYGSVDSTPLFLILLGEYTRWTGDMSLFERLRDPVEKALGWIDNFGDHDGDGYIDYQSEGGKRLINQGWKDSGNGIVDSDGHIAEAPIALVEVQGYVYKAKYACAWLFEKTGDKRRAARLRSEADQLKARFNEDYWVPGKDFYALALERGKRPLQVVSSNPGQALWTGIIIAERVQAVVSHLMATDMYNGWGIRTLSSREAAYNPVAYHLGTVWPHDNAIIAAGMRRSGFDQEACRIASGLLEAASHFKDYRLPEVFSGFAHDEFGVPVHYPVACHPQAWAAGSVPFLLQVLLGLEPDPFNQRLDIVRPRLPQDIRRVQLKRLPVGPAQADLLFERGANGALNVRVQAVRGKLDVAVKERS